MNNDVVIEHIRAHHRTKAPRLLPGYHRGLIGPRRRLTVNLQETSSKEKWFCRCRPLSTRDATEVYHGLDVYVEELCAKVQGSTMQANSKFVQQSECARVQTLHRSPNSSTTCKAPTFSEELPRIVERSAGQ
eukprot:6456291-Amphidinium_carterae.3